MSDGWETRRTQVGRGNYGPDGDFKGKERKEWVVAKLAGTGVVRWVEVDTAFHPGNYPVVSIDAPQTTSTADVIQACAIEAILNEEVGIPRGLMADRFRIHRQRMLYGQLPSRRNP